jgi:hypothetical protein
VNGPSFSRRAGELEVEALEERARDWTLPKAGTQSSPNCARASCAPSTAVTVAVGTRVEE